MEARTCSPSSRPSLASEAPIGIFDSGIGGLTVAHAIARVLPAERLSYFGDTAHMPCGDRSPELVPVWSVRHRRAPARPGVQGHRHCLQFGVRHRSLSRAGPRRGSRAGHRRDFPGRPGCRWSGPCTHWRHRDPGHHWQRHLRTTPERRRIRLRRRGGGVGHALLAPLIEEGWRDHSAHGPRVALLPRRRGLDPGSAGSH